MAGEPGEPAAVVDMTAAAAPTAAPASSKPKEEEDAKKTMQVPFSDLFFFATGFDWFLVRCVLLRVHADFVLLVNRGSADPATLFFFFF